jgi:hypothetical protein
LKKDDFLKTCFCYKDRKHLIVLNTRFGPYDWPETLEVDGDAWKFESNCPFKQSESGHGGKAIYHRKDRS